ncbi:MAG: HAD-IIA family hydrolase [Campylobacterales bacterium]|nr:HAD-IIA family hydrolase [Campylobacterales bacterium]
MFFIDVQGTLIDDATKLPLSGAVEFINHLNSVPIPYMVITNSTKYRSEEFLGYLNGIGLNIPASHYLDPLMVLEDHISHDKKIAAYGSEEFLNVLKSMGYSLDFTNPDVVLVAIKEDFSADEYAQMIEFLLGGAELIGMHETSLYVKNAKRYPGVGAIMKMLEFATACSYSIVGKPSTPFFETALGLLSKQKAGIGFSDVTIISDDVTGDLLPAQELGMRGVFVLSGKYRTAEEIVPQLRVKPDAIYPNMKAVLEGLWKH